MAQIQAAHEKDSCRQESKLYLKMVCNDKSLSNQDPVSGSQLKRENYIKQEEKFTRFASGSVSGSHKEDQQMIRQSRQIYKPRGLSRAGNNYQ